MPALTATELILLNLRCASVIGSILEFNKKWAAQLIKHQEEVSDLIRTGHSHYVELLQCLMELRAMCIHSRFMLDTIKMELTIAIENQSFDYVNVYEITTSSRRLKVGFEAFNQRFKNIEKDVLLFSKSVKKEREKLINEPCSIDYTALSLNSLSAALTIGCTYLDFEKKSRDERNMEIALSMSAGGINITSGIATAMLKGRKSQKMMKLYQVLGKVETKVPALFNTVAEFRAGMKDPMVYIDNQIELAEKNIVECIRKDPVRVVAQARSMLKNVSELDIMFNGIQDKAKEHSDLLRSAIRSENPRTLIYLE